MKQKIKILHLEDLKSDAELIARELKRGKIDSEILVVPNKAKFIRALNDFSYDIILSDHSLASFDSREALRLVKEADIAVPFILVTATMTDEFAATIMKEGAYDYILKDRLQRLPSAVINSIEKQRLKEAHKVEQGRAIQQLIKSEKFNSGVLNSLSAHIAVIDNLGNIIAVNEVWHRFGIENVKSALPRTEVGSNYFHVCDKLAKSGKEMAAEALEGMKDVMNDRKPVFYLEYLCDSTERERWFGMRVMKFESDKAMVVVSHQDITEGKLAEIERNGMVNDLVLRNNDLEQFAYIISHNLRGPVANIIGASSALNDSELSIEDKATLNKGINESVIRLDGVVKDLNNILEVKGKINKTKEMIRFSELIDDIKIDFKNLIEKESIEIKYDFSEINEFLTLKPYLYSIFYNLISNSIKYRQQQVCGIIKIKSRRVRNEVELTFADNGMGIDLDKRGDQVFGLYKRFHTNIEGKGMGLFMVKAQVEALGGKISIQSAENKGTEFNIILNYE